MPFAHERLGTFIHNCQLVAPDVNFERIGKRNAIYTYMHIFSSAGHVLPVGKLIVTDMMRARCIVRDAIFHNTLLCAISSSIRLSCIMNFVKSLNSRGEIVHRSQIIQDCHVMDVVQYGESLQDL